jgi:hypothetical protein
MEVHGQSRILIRILANMGNMARVNSRSEGASCLADVRDNIPHLLLADFALGLVDDISGGTLPTCPGIVIGLGAHVARPLGARNRLQARPHKTAAEGGTGSLSNLDGNTMPTHKILDFAFINTTVI